MSRKLGAPQPAEMEAAAPAGKPLSLGTPETMQPLTTPPISLAGLQNDRSSVSVGMLLENVNDTFTDLPYATRTPKGFRGAYHNFTKLIQIFKSRTMATFAHESGHHWLFRMIDKLADPRLADEAYTRISKDLNEVLLHMGVTDVDASSSPEAIRAAISKKQHDTWAESVEAYLHEGIAPSPKMEKVFTGFSQWLRIHYKSIYDLDVEPTPEIRQVLDNILAAGSPTPPLPPQPPRKTD